MIDPHSPLDCSSSHLERVAIERFRQLNPDLPASCVIFREPWERSTVLCLDLAACIDRMDEILDRGDDLSRTLHDLGLGRAIIFRIGSKLVGWREVGSQR